MTLKAFSLLKNADVVLAGSLVPDSILRLANGEVYRVGRLISVKHRELAAVAVKYAREGKTVWFLKRGSGYLREEGGAMCRG